MAKQAVALGASGFVLGPLLDGMHTSHNVLHYTDPIHLQIRSVGYDLETCWWVGPAGLPRAGPRDLLSLPAVLSVCLEHHRLGSWGAEPRGRQTVLRPRDWFVDAGWV